MCSPPPTPLHQSVLDHLAQLVRPLAAQAQCVVRQGVGLRLPGGSGERYVIPDLVVATKPMPPLYYDARAVRVVAEVESPGSRLADRGTKRALYAEAGIAEYWLLDSALRTLRVWQLSGGDYRQVDSSPFLPSAVDWEALTADE